MVSMFNKNYAAHYDTIYKDKPYEEEVKFVYEWAGKPKWIFDIGCGSASYWKYYPPGTGLIGIDRSRSMAKDSNQIIYADITKYKPNGKFDCATALFDVLNYIPRHDWWKNIPVKKGGYFIFDIWDKKKVDKEGFRETSKQIDYVFRRVTPRGYDGKKVNLLIEVMDEFGHGAEEHTLYIYSDKDIKKFCGKEFEIVDIKSTKTWQRWFKCRRK